jgi:hypothetical protein
MPSSIRSIFAAAGLEPGGPVEWGQAIPAPETGPTTGVYVVAFTAAVDATGNRYPACPLSKEALDALLGARPELRLDGARPDAVLLGERLAAFWLPEEPVLYIGLAGPRKRPPTSGELSKRVAEYYATPLGARSPHAGGWPLKTLSILDEMLVHYAYCERVRDAERMMLDAFVQGMSPAARVQLHDSERVMPFANLEFPPGVRKRHGITGAKEPRRSA